MQTSGNEPRPTADGVQLQRDYYTRTADKYDDCHAEGGHEFALEILAAAIHRFGVRSVLDVGTGTGRTLEFLARRFPGVRAVGVEPVEALREVGYAKGIPRDALIDGSGERLPAADGAFDLVCEFGILHHVPKPGLVVKEMLRVAKAAVVISDSNCYGQGSALGRTVKRALRATGLWPLAVWAKTRGKGYHVSEGDGVFYPYSAFDDYPLLARACQTVHVMNCDKAGVNPLASAGHVILLGVKPGAEPLAGAHG